MRKSDTPVKIFLLTASVVLLASSTWAMKRWQQVTMTAVNGLAFYDCNANGLRDNNESTFANIAVTLTGRTTAGDSVNVSTTTNSTGNYSFIGLAAGQFVVKFAFPSGSMGLNFTIKNTAINGSDANPNGATDPLRIDGLTDVQGIDVGIIDNSAPIVTFVNPFLLPYANGDTITVECDNLPTMNASWATAQDNSGAPVLVQFIDLARSVNDCARTGYITLLDCIFRATDACGNVGQKSVFVKVKDSKAPVLTNVPADITVNTTRGERIPTASSANVVGTDNCSTNPVAATVLDSEVANTCGKIITRTWLASDDCGNVGRATQRVTVISNVLCLNPLPTDTFHLVLSTNQVLDTCFSLPTGNIISNIQHCGTGLARTTITLTASNCIRVTPSVNFAGRDTFCARVCDVSGLNCYDIAFILNVKVNNSGRPVAVDDRVTTRLNTLATFSVLANDTLNGILTAPLSIVRFQNHGSVNVVNNQIVYTPTMGYCNANDTLDYQICNINGCDTGRLIVAIACDSIPSGGSGAPIVAVNDNVTTRKNTSLTFRPTLNDTVRTRLLSLMIASPPRNGTIAFRGLDTLLYTPNFNFCGRDTIAYMICDTSFRCAEALIFIHVNCDSAINSLVPIAVNDTARTGVNQAVVVSVLQNDTLRGVLSRPLSITASPRFGTARVDRNNQIIYTPQPGFCDSRDTLTYEICTINGCDTALVSINVVCDSNTLRRLPVAVPDYVNARKRTPIRISVLTNDTLNGTLDSIRIINVPRRGTASIGADNVLTYATDTCGFADTLIYRICNRNGCDTALVSINVICDSLTATQPPVAVFDVATTPKNTPIRIAILANDTLNGTLDSIKIIRSPLLGMASLDRNNFLTYTPDSCGFTDSLIYRICNRNGCDTAIVFIKVACDTVITNFLQPVAVFDTVRTAKGQLVTIQVTLNDTLRGADTFRITRRPLNGLAIFDTNRQIAYTPDALYCGNDTLIYEVCNTRGCDTAIVFIRVVCDTTSLLRPTAVDDNVKTTINRQVDFVILGNDILRGARSAEMVSPPSRGTIIIMPDSMAMYKPDKEFCGRDSFLYRICNTVGCDTAWVKIDVSCGDTLQVFRGFSPNNDRINDVLVIRGIENYPDNEVLIFNRWGNQVFTRKGYRNEDGWDGSWNQKFVPDGTYFYFIKLNNPKNQQFTGYIQLVR